ncbi:MAG: transglutaminase-like domain-containing protein [Candidatus Aenigmatarchaeota archaeon]
MKEKILKAVTCLILFSLVLVVIVPAVSSNSSLDRDEHDDGDDENTSIQKFSVDVDSDLYIPYRRRYNTLKYEGWETRTVDGEEITIATEKAVVRRGSTVLVQGDTEKKVVLSPSKSNMDDLDMSEVEGGWEVDIPEDSTIGKYVLKGESERIDIFVIFDPLQTGLSEEKLKGYAYDEEGTRDEYGYIFTTGYNEYPREGHPPNLVPFGDDHEDRPSMFDFALAGAGNSSDPQESAGRLTRIVAQRNDAKPTGLFNIRDASDILFYGNESPYTKYLFDLDKEGDLTEGEVPDWLREQFEEKNTRLPENAQISRAENKIWIVVDGEKLGGIEEHGEILRIYDKPITYTDLDGDVKEVEGLTLKDAERLAVNGASIHDLESEGKSKIINGWCDEVSFALTALLRSIGIPSRVVSIHPTSEVDQDLMGHFMVEAWFEEPMYESSWEEEGEGGGWYVLDADEWNARWHTADPVFWMPVGETFSSRKNYMRVIDVLFEERWKTRDLYVFGPEDEMFPPTEKVTDAYIGAGEHEPEFGSVTKMMGRGGGDLYKLNIEKPTKISISSDQGTKPSIYVSQEGYPSIPITTQGYPFDEPSEYQGEEVILLPEESDTYYIGIYAPHNGDRQVEGDFGSYTLTVEEADEDELKGEHQRLEDEEKFTQEHMFAIVLMLVWIAAYVGKKKL